MLNLTPSVDFMHSSIFFSSLYRNTTYESGDVGKYDKVWVSNPGSGLEKRQCTFQVCFSAEDNSTRIEIVFRGKSDGKYINEIEKQSYHKGVNVYWQANAWMDLDRSLQWVEKTLKPATQGSEDEFLLLCDNLGCQTNVEFQKAVRKINGLVYYGLKGNYIHLKYYLLSHQCP